MIGGGGLGRIKTVPVQSNTANVQFNDFINNGYNDGWAVTGEVGFNSNQNYLSDVGAYTKAVSPSGTFDQGGNVVEWNESLFLETQETGQVLYRSIRGGDFTDNPEVLRSDVIGFQLPSLSFRGFGFRVAGIPSVPEPSTLALAALGAFGLLIAARRGRSMVS